MTGTDDGSLSPGRGEFRLFLVASAGTFGTAAVAGAARAPHLKSLPGKRMALVLPPLSLPFERGLVAPLCSNAVWANLHATTSKPVFVHSDGLGHSACLLEPARSSMRSRQEHKEAVAWSTSSSLLREAAWQSLTGWYSIVPASPEFASSVPRSQIAFRFLQLGRAMDSASGGKANVASISSSAPAASSKLSALDIKEKLLNTAEAVLGAGADIWDSPLMDSGIDSLSSVEFRNRLSEDFGVSLPQTLIFDYPSLATISGYLGDTLIAEEDYCLPARCEAKSPETSERERVVLG
eukprot:TRINITY_DN67796_c0_g2_i1.p1 TRINITY_DN67796_c0_g2~~TRINITY_DN67796_c0_g2_i1.p1  ORF type:complete len:335 (-),score=32.45 TRINITY_DN67796_c0_g2_i1:19-900(-)